MRTRMAAVVAGICALGAWTVAPAHAEDTPTVVTVSSATVGTSSIIVNGALAVGSDSAQALTIATDPVGDATRAGVGWDIGDATVVADAKAKSFTFKLALHDGLNPQGSVPATGWDWPIQVDFDNSQNRWLGATTPGGNLGKTSNWTGLCTVTTGWSCTTTLAGSITATKVEWIVPFGTLNAKVGSTVSPGGIYGGIPASFGWPAAYILVQTAPYDTMSSAVSEFIVPGSVQVALLPAGITPDPSEFSEPIAPRTSGGFTLSLAKPTTPGAYTVHVQSCWGLVEDPSCAAATHDLTV